MKGTLLVGILLYIFPAVFAQTARVEQLEHSLRWLTESNFPAYLNDSNFEQALILKTDSALMRKLSIQNIEFPEHFDYKLISYFGKSKIKLPKSKNEDYMIGISSAITRGTSNYKVYWQMKVEIRQGKKVILNNEIEHELEPFSFSIRLSNQAWIDAEEFLITYHYMLEECLQLRDFKPGIISLGSIGSVRKKITNMMPIDKEYTLAVSGAIMEQSNSSYQLLADTTLVNEFYFKPTNQVDLNFSISGSKVLTGLFSEISGIDTYYTLKSKEKRTGAIFDQNKQKRKIQLDWLEEVQQSTNGDDGVLAQIISPVSGSYFDNDSLIAQFIFYNEIQKVNELNMKSLHEMHFQMRYEDLVESIYSIIGDYNGNKFEVTYREFDQLVFISVQDELLGILSLMNINPDSRSYRGIKLSKNMGAMVSSQKIVGRPELETSTAEWYPLYVNQDVNEETVTEMGHFILLLFFTISHME